VLLIDDMMPEITGSQVCYQLKRDGQTAHLPIILFSAGSDVLDEHLMREIGADAALRKPAHPSLLISTVERLVHQRASAV
jgi:CheY-like chemotaxis protein